MFISRPVVRKLKWAWYYEIPKPIRHSYEILHTVNGRVDTVLRSVNLLNLINRWYKSDEQFTGP